MNAAEQRDDWKKFQEHIDVKKLVFLDKTRAKTNMTPTHGRAEIGKHVIDFVPHGHWKTTTFLSALRCDGLTAPLVIDGAINGKIFLAWLKQQLCPMLKVGDIVVMDNLSSHKISGVKEAIESVGATVLYLPSYSPDLNPIEMVFAKLKHFVRKSKPRCVTDLWKKLSQFCDIFSPTECQNYFRYAGYKFQHITQITPD